jgi:hypothetical protein
VTEFIKDYQPRPSDETGDRSHRAQAQDDWERIAKYVVANCVDRMSARVSHISSLTLLVGHAKLPPSDLLRHWNTFRQTERYDFMARKKRKDESLFIAAKNAKNSKSVKLLAQYKATAASGLITIVENIDPLIAALGDAQTDSTEPAYSGETCVHFHHFYVDTLIGYMRSLTAAVRQKKAKTAETETSPIQEDKREAHPGGGGALNPTAQQSTSLAGLMETVYHYADLLWRITTSRMFDYHLEVLELAAGDHSFKPKRDRVLPFFSHQLVSGEPDAIAIDVAPTQKEVEEGDKDGAGKMNAGIQTEIGETSVNTDTVYAKQTLRRWASLLSGHLMALHVLAYKVPRPEGDSPTNMEPIQITIIAVNRRLHGLLKNGIVLDWHEAFQSIRNANTAIHAETKDYIQDEIDNGGHGGCTSAFGKTPEKAAVGQTSDGASNAGIEMSSKSATGSQTTLLSPGRNDDEQNESPKRERSSIFNLINLTRTKSKKDAELQPQGAKPRTPGQFLFKATLHCEAVLAALLKFPALGCRDDAKLLEVVEVMHTLLILTSGLTIVQTTDKSVIGVSKLCCPVCHWFLKELGGEEGLFAADGPHETLYPVTLPRWLPKHILQKSLSEFQGILVSEVIEFQRKRKSKTPFVPPLGYSRNASQDSTSGLSGVSHTSSKDPPREIPGDDSDLDGVDESHSAVPAP